MKERVNWWWYFLCSGILIPTLFSFTTGQVFAFSYLRGLFVMGLNPFSGYIIFYILIPMIPALAITVAFKNLGKMELANDTARILQVAVAVGVIIFILGGLFQGRPYPSALRKAMMYHDGENVLPMQQAPGISIYTIASLIELLVFAYFFIRNFPKTSNAKTR